MPLQVLCYERADDIAAGVSGVVTRGRAIRASFPELDPSEIPMAVAVKQEKVLYLLDPIGASRRSRTLRAGRCGDSRAAKLAAGGAPRAGAALHAGISAKTQWPGDVDWAVQSMGRRTIDEHRTGAGVAGIAGEHGAVRWKGGDRRAAGRSGSGSRWEFLMRVLWPGMDVRAQLTVVGDGPVGAVGKSIDEKFGMPTGHGQHEWAVGMKMVVELPEDTPLEAGTVWHTFGYPEPEIFGFLYVHPERLASVGIFVPSWLGNPARSSYRYLQHFMQHPYLWRYLNGSTMRSWGAKSLQESGKNGEPFLAGDGYARIGEGSGSTNMLTGSGVDEAWATGVQLAEAVAELLRAGKPFTRENLEAAYVRRRRMSFVERGAQAAREARNGFHQGVVRGLIGMGLAGLTNGRLSLGAKIRPAHKQIETLKKFYARRLKPEQLEKATREAATGGRALHDALMDACGWPEIAYDGKLLVSHQDALLMGGKVQAVGGFADHVIFRDPRLCGACAERTCIAMCSGQAITQGEGTAPAFDREKCIHCGACLWNCTQSPDGENSNIEFRAGAGGLHSAEN